MKELTIEQKAKRYDEAIKRAEYYYNEDKTLEYANDIVSSIFPELKESDERIRKELVDFIYDKTDTYELREKSNSWLAWLEKQGEQKPTDKVEPKFKVGDWITHNTANFVFKIINVGSNWYEVVNRENYKKTISFDCEDKYHIWTIRDAKDGDVLTWDDTTCIVLFKNIKNSKCFISYCFANNIYFEIGTSHYIEGCHPATKEQRDFLFEKMKEAGYVCDAEKKELKKIEQKPVIPKFRVGDIIIDNIGVFPHKKIEAIENENYVVRCLYTNNQQCIPINAQDEYILVNKKPAWSEEDEDMIQALNACINAAIKGGMNYISFGSKSILIEKVKNWLKSLRR